MNLLILRKFDARVELLEKMYSRVGKMKEKSDALASKKRTKLDQIFYGGENRSPNLPHKTAKKKTKSIEDSSTPTVIVSSPEVAEATPQAREFRTARELFQPQERAENDVQPMEIDLDVEVEALVNLDMPQQSAPAVFTQGDQRLARIAQERLDQIARVFAPLDRKENMSEPDFLKDGQNYINKKIFEELKDHGEFLYKGPNGRCWANYPSHPEVYLQPVELEESKLFFKSANSLPTAGSTWTSAIYKRENGEIVPVHIVSESVLGEIHRLKEYRLKFQSKNIPHLAKLCLIIKVKDEVAKNVLIQRYVDYLNAVNSNPDHFPIIRICYKENQAYKLTRELDYQAVIDLNRRATLDNHFQTLQIFLNAYENANLKLQHNLRQLAEKGDILSFNQNNLESEKILSEFALEDIEEYEGYLLTLRKELLRIKDSMEKARLQTDGVDEFLAHVTDDIGKMTLLISNLHNLSEDYRDYLYQLDSFLCLGEFRQNPRLSSSQIENQLLQKIIFWADHNHVDSRFIKQFDSPRVLFATMLRNELLMHELNRGPLPLDQKIELVSTMVKALEELANKIDVSPIMRV